VSLETAIPIKKIVFRAGFNIRAQLRLAFAQLLKIPEKKQPINNPFLLFPSSIDACFILLAPALRAAGRLTAVMVFRRLRVG
jgi:hypothetical protein